MSWAKTKRLPIEGPEPTLGPGRSRPFPTESTREYKVRVTWARGRPMTITIDAPTKAKALMYCQNRWPDCSAEVLQ
jgi:hypothetical protein